MSLKIYILFLITHSATITANDCSQHVHTKISLIRKQVKILMYTYILPFCLLKKIYNTYIHYMYSLLKIRFCILICFQFDITISQ